MPQAYADRPSDIRDRLEVQTVADLAAGLEINADNVQTFNPDGNEVAIPDSGIDEGTPPEAWAVVTFGDEDGIHPGGDFNGDAGCAGAETLILPVTVDLHLGVMPPEYDQPGGGGFRKWKNYWIARAKAALMDNIQSTEGGVGTSGHDLAINTRIVGTFGPVVSDKQLDTLVGVDAHKLYRHEEGDPATLY